MPGSLRSGKRERQSARADGLVRGGVRDRRRSSRRAGVLWGGGRGGKAHGAGDPAHFPGEREATCSLSPGLPTVCDRTHGGKHHVRKRTHMSDSQRIGEKGRQ